MPARIGASRSFSRADLGMGIDQRLRSVFRRDAHAGARFQEIHERIYPRLPLWRAGTAPDFGKEISRDSLAALQFFRGTSTADEGGHRARESHVGIVATLRHDGRSDRHLAQRPGAVL